MINNFGKIILLYALKKPSFWLIKKILPKILTDNNLKRFATELNNKVDIPVLSEEAEQKVIEDVVFAIGKALLNWAQQKEEWWKVF